MKKILRIILYVFGSVLLLLLLLVGFIISPPGKRFVRDKAVSFLRGKLKTEVYIAEVAYSFPKMIGLKGVLLKDQQRDTLLSVGLLQVDIDMLKLINRKVSVNDLVVQHLHAYVHRDRPDTAFNFSYIIDAFASKEPPGPEDTSDKKSAPFVFDVGTLRLEDIHIRFEDSTGGIHLVTDLERLRIRMRELDPVQMIFRLRSLQVEGLYTSFVQDTSLLPPSDTGSAQPMQLAAEELDLKDIDFTFDGRLSRFFFDLKLGRLLAHPETIDLDRQRLVIRDLQLDTTRADIVIGKQSPAPAAIDEVVDTLQGQGWDVQLAAITIRGLDVNMDNENRPRQLQGMDYAHLGVSDLMFQASDLHYAADAVSGSITQLSVKEKSGLDLKTLRTDFFYTDTAAALRNFFLETPYTVLQDRVEARYPSVAALGKDIALLQLDIQLPRSRVGIPDVLLFAPQLRQQALFRDHAQASLQLDLLLRGYLSDLDIQRFHVAGLSNTEVDMKGKLRGLPEQERISYVLDIARLRSGSKDLAPLLPAKALAQVRLPDAFLIKGSISGTTKDYRPDLLFQSTDGAARIKGMLLLSPGTAREQYDLELHTKALNIGRMIRKDTLMGPVTADLRVKGKSFDPKQMTATLNGAIHAALLKGYAYRDIRFNGNMDAQQGNLELVSADPNARLQLRAAADLRRQYPAVLADLIIDSADLQALKLYEKPLRVQAGIHADVPVLDPDYPDGALSVQKLVVAANGTLYQPDSIYIVARSHPDSGQRINASLGFMQAALSGQIPLSKIGMALQEHIDRHYQLAQPGTADSMKAPRPGGPAPGGSLAGRRVTASDTGTKPVLPALYDMQLNAVLHRSPFLEAFLPELTRLDTVKVAAEMDQAGLQLDLSAPGITYGTNQLQNLTAGVHERDSGLDYNISLATFNSGKLQLLNTTAKGVVDANLVTTDLSSEDEKGARRFSLGASLKKEGTAQALSLNPGLLLNYEEWTVAQPNKIVFGPEGFYAQQVQLSGNGATIAVNSDRPEFNAPLTATIDNFLIADVLQLVSGDTLFANGVISANARLKQLKPAPLIDADVRIRNLSVLNDTIGDLHLLAANTGPHTINTSLGITGYGNDIQAKGDYYTQTTGGNDFDLSLSLNALNLRSFEGLAQGQIKNSSGFVRGKLNARGTATSPDVAGELTMDRLETTVSMLNATLKMPQEKILLDNTGVHFRQFKIEDSAGQTATIDGSILTRNFRDMMLDLQLKARNWQALGSGPADNKLFYGRLFLTTNLSVEGPLTKPNVNGSLNILKGTDLTVVLPEKGQSLEDQAGIVVFIDKNSAGRIKPKPQEDTAILVRVSPGSELNVNVTTDKDAEFNVIIDQSTGDFLRVRGSASLNTALDAGGRLSLNGLYELSEGAYELNYNLIKRKFEISKGSTITFAGDPMDAEMNITAIYKALVAPYDLVEKQVADPAQLIYYRQALPFNVQLKMLGPLMSPALSFDVVLPENNTYRLSSDAVQLVQARLNQLRSDTSELNKQVFALLILKRFISDDPFSSQGGGGAGFAAKQSVSRFLGEQINQLANRLLRGVDFSVDLASTEDYTTGQRRERTDLNISASKRLFDDRLKVTIGNNFELEGPQTQNRDPNSSLIPGNLAVDYNLSADGRYVVRAYRQNQDQGVIQGFVTETGVNFILSYDYNKFKNLFVRKKVLEMRRKQRQQQSPQQKPVSQK